MTTTAAFWNDLAEKYAAKPVDDVDAFERKIAITKSLMQPSDVVVEFGCGTGSLAMTLAPHAGHIHAIDVSSQMVQIARDKADKQGVTNLSFHVERCDQFNAIDPGTADGILAYSILHLLDDIDGMLAKIFELLTPGGYFVSSTVLLGESWVPYRPLIAVMQWFGKAPPIVQNLTRAQLEAAASQAGFVDIEFPDVGAQKVVAFMTARKPS